MQQKKDQGEEIKGLCSLTPKAHYKAPQGGVTRGKTAPNRLRRVDNFLCLYDPELLRNGSTAAHREACFVDLGYGARPFTTLESARTLRQRLRHPSLLVLGVEIERKRVREALRYADERTLFRVGGFNLPFKPPKEEESLPFVPLVRELRHAKVIRAFNVLRQYEEAAVREAFGLLAGYLLPGGLLLEGTSDPFGRIWVMNVMRRPRKARQPQQSMEPQHNKQKRKTAAVEYPAWYHAIQPHPSLLSAEALVFSTNFKSEESFDPSHFLGILPKNHIQHMREPGQPIHDFMEEWQHCAEDLIAIRQRYGQRQHFVATAMLLEERGWPVDTSRGRRWLRLGFLILYLQPVIARYQQLSSSSSSSSS
ncbi:Methylase [Balamuthia mandrillaris]